VESSQHHRTTSERASAEEGGQGGGYEPQVGSGLIVFCEAGKQSSEMMACIDVRSLGERGRGEGVLVEERRIVWKRAHLGKRAHGAREIGDQLYQRRVGDHHVLAVLSHCTLISK
jgi:hypothetical protein